jgi:hypothetical protein
MESFMRLMMLAVLLMVSWVVHAASHFPNGCQPMPISEGSIKLAQGEPSLILFHNISQSDIWVTHPITDPSASAGWSSRLQVKKWSAFAKAKDAFEISCIESKPGHEQQVPCSLVLNMCQWPKVVGTNKQPPPFWAGENMSLKALLEYLAQRGFKL